jgi:hypothetical protein
VALLELPVERTVSRRGLHAATTLIVVIRREGSVEVISKPDKTEGRGTYARGYAGKASVKLGPGDVAVHLRLVKTSSGRILGRVTVYSHEGREILRAVYRHLKVRRSWGDPAYSWAVEAAFKHLGLDKYVRKYNWG